MCLILLLWPAVAATAFAYASASASDSALKSSWSCYCVGWCAYVCQLSMTAEDSLCLLFSQCAQVGRKCSARQGAQTSAAGSANDNFIRGHDFHTLNAASGELFSPRCLRFLHNQSTGLFVSAGRAGLFATVAASLRSASGAAGRPACIESQPASQRSKCMCMCESRKSRI